MITTIVYILMLSLLVLSFVTWVRVLKNQENDNYNKNK